MRSIFFILIVFLGCQNCSRNTYKPSKKQVLVNRVRKQVAASLQNKYGLIPAGKGGQMMYQVEKLMLIFNYPKPLSETEAGELVINAVEEFLFAINQEEELRQYLANYPFKPKNVEITIFLQDSRGTKVQPDKFGIVEAVDGYVICTAIDPKTHEYRTVFKETFEEVKAKCFINAVPKVG